MFEVEYLWNGCNKKDGVNANLVLCTWPNFRYPIDFALSSHVRKTSQDYYIKTEMCSVLVMMTTFCRYYAVVKKCTHEST